MTRSVYAQKVLDEATGGYANLVAAYGLGTTHKTNTGELAKAMKTTVSGAARRLRMYRELGLITWTQKGAGAGMGWNSYATCNVDSTTATKQITAWFDAGHSLREIETAMAARYHARQAAKKAPATTTTEPLSNGHETDVTVAIVGPDAPTPFEALRAIRKDEVGAILEAARQYAGRKTAVFEAFDNLAKLGISVDIEKAMTAVHFDTDTTLETITQLLPYIEGLEAKAGQTSEWKGELVELRRENSQLRKLYNDEKGANKRLSDRMAQIRTQMATIGLRDTDPHTAPTV